MISIENISKRYGEKTVVDSLSLQVPSGKIFAFIGPNGAGKTTTVKMMVGLLHPTSGRITIAGHDVQKEPHQVKEVIAYIPDQPYLYEKLSGREFLRFIARMYGINHNSSQAERERSPVSSQGIGDEIDRYLNLFDMTDYIDQLIETYSLGMRQRLIISAGFLRRPKVIVVDEPLVGLDPHSTLIVKQLFRTEANNGATIFMSTHLLSVAEEIADGIGLINEGKLIAQGTFAELKEKYQFQQTCSLEEVFMKATREEA